MLSRRTPNYGGINVKEEKEFKLWVKFILSIQKEGGDVNKPLEILWESVKKELDNSNKKLRRKGIIC